MRQKSSAATVILVHGLWMTGMELRWLGRKLADCGFVVRYFRYASWQGNFEHAAAELGQFVAQETAGRVHLLGHSLGGLVIARMLAQAEPANLGRIVLLGSPQQGSLLAATMERYRAGRVLLGPVAGAGIVRNRPAPPAGRELLVIAGTLSFGFARFFGVASPNDGTVAVAETAVQGARQLLVRASHMGMLFSRVAVANICLFLQTDNWQEEIREPPGTHRAQS